MRTANGSSSETQREPDPWAAAQGYLQELLDDHSYKNWFAQTRYESFDNGKLVVGVPSQFFADWLRDHYMEAVCESVRQVAPELESVAFIPSAEVAQATQKAPAPEAAPTPGARTDQVRRPFHGLNPRYTFDNFVIGSNNRFAHAAARGVAESPGRAYNPLFLYGATGLGKTHLMQAIGHSVLHDQPNASVVFISSEQFTNQLIESIAKKSTQRFRERYRKVDVLLIDDIHFIAGKEATQEEFFHTFNALFDMHKQIVLSSDRGPKEIQGMEDRLVSRFEWGLVTDVQPPDLETRVAILQSKAKHESLKVPEDVLRYIATYVTTNIRELEGVLITLFAYSRLKEEKISLTMAEEVLRDLVGSERIRPVTIDNVMRVVAQEFDVRISDMRGRSRQRQVAYPRQVAMYLVKTLVPGISLKDIGEAFGGKDHTTVLYAVEKLAKSAKETPTVRSTLDKLTKQIRDYKPTN